MNPHTFNEAPVLAALIAAFSALLIAVVQFFMQRRQSTSIEELRARLAQQGASQSKYLETYLNLLIEGRQQQSQAYAALLQGIQLLRDFMRNFLGQPESYDPDAISSQISEQANSILMIYSANQLNLGDEGRRVGHEAKNLARDAARAFEGFRQTFEPNSEPVEQLTEIREIETLLGESQTRLRQLAFEANRAIVRALEAGNATTLP